MKRSRAFDVLRRLDPVRTDELDPESDEARSLLARITEHEPGADPAPRRPRLRRLAPALVAILVIVPAAVWLLAAYGPLLGHDGPLGTSGPPTSGPAPTATTATNVTPPPPEPSPPGRFEWSGTVLQMGDRPAMLCPGGIATSLPPQCGNVPVPNWDWDAVDGERRMHGTIWGDYHVVGRYDGSTFTVEQVDPPRPSPSETEDPITTPCPEPSGGWRAADPARTSEADRTAALRVAGAEPDFAGIWIDRAPGTPPHANAGPGVILNAAFTGDLDRHRAELERLWGGPLCVVRFEHTEDELLRIQRELGDEQIRERFGLHLLGSGVDVVRNRVEVEVVWADESQRAAIDERYGPGVVAVHSAFTPVG